VKKYAIEIVAYCEIQITTERRRTGIKSTCVCGMAIVTEPKPGESGNVKPAKIGIAKPRKSREKCVVLRNSSPTTRWIHYERKRTRFSIRAEIGRVYEKFEEFLNDLFIRTIMPRRRPHTASVEHEHFKCRLKKKKNEWIVTRICLKRPKRLPEMLCVCVCVCVSLCVRFRWRIE